jgi:hypothetical protein
MIHGVGRDARHIADHIAAHNPLDVPAAPATTDAGNAPPTETQPPYRAEAPPTGASPVAAAALA